MLKKNSLGAHNSRILFWVQFFGSASFLQPVITLFYMQNGLTEREIFWLIMCWSGAVLISEVPTGIYADKFGPKISFMTGAIVKILSLALLLGADYQILLFLSSLLSGCSVTFFSGADEALLYESLKKSNDENKMDRVMGRISSATFITSLATVLIGAFLAKNLTEGQFDLLIYLGMVSFIFVFVLSAFIIEPKAEIPYRENAFSHVSEGYRIIKKTPELFLMFMNLTLVFIPAAAVFQNFDQPLLNSGISVTGIGVVYSIAEIIGFVATHRLDWLLDRVSGMKLFFITGLAAGVSLLIISQLGNKSLIVILCFLVLRFVSAIRYPIYSQIQNDLIPSHVRATTISLLSVLDSICDLIIFGSLSGIAVFGLSPIFLVCGIIAILASFIPIRKAKESIKNNLAV
ncbi:MFS transporter [Peribacillus alkalitolerans]|uniref:MFS transporter n=1 Tax=Peribacillus alkalitolerans TaxID=1550385 RepID=UPI0013D52B0B|nr:MFS transporter [Peribacillus alkalitolerans]